MMHDASHPVNDAMIENLLLSYAAGGLAAPEALLVATLMAVNATARRKVARYEALGGRVIEDEAPAKLNNTCFDSIMSRIENCGPKPCAPAKAAPCETIPQPLRVLLKTCDSFDTGAWSGGPSVSQMELRAPAGTKGRLFLMRISPNARVETHTHTAPEIMLVLEGSYSDAFGQYKKGDVSVIADPRVAHAPAAGPEGCVCLLLLQGPVRVRRKFFRFFAISFR